MQLYKLGLDIKNELIDLSNLDNKTLLPNQNFVKKALKRVLTTNNTGVLTVSIENLENYKSVYTEVAADKLIQTFIAIAKSFK